MKINEEGEGREGERRNECTANANANTNTTIIEFNWPIPPPPSLLHFQYCLSTTFKYNRNAYNTHTYSGRINHVYALRYALQELNCLPPAPATKAKVKAKS